MQYITYRSHIFQGRIYPGMYFCVHSYATFVWCRICLWKTLTSRVASLATPEDPRRRQKHTAPPPEEAVGGWRRWGALSLGMQTDCPADYADIREVIFFSYVKEYVSVRDLAINNRIWIRGQIFVPTRTSAYIPTFPFPSFLVWFISFYPQYFCCRRRVESNLPRDR
jgi:hypothetical protein